MSASIVAGSPEARPAQAARRPFFRRKSAIPGFALTMGVTLLALSCIVLIPLSAAAVKAAGLSWDGFVAAAFSTRAIKAYELSFGAAGVAAVINGVFGVLTAWALVRYRFPGKPVINAVIDALDRAHGIRAIDMPATPLKVWTAIQAAGQVAAE